jgi:hypothetical protein
VTSLYLRDSLLIDMTADERTRRQTGFPRSDRVGKVFVALSQDMRQCLICDGVFTKQGSAAHADAACHPSEGNSRLEGESEYADR